MSGSLVKIHNYFPKIFFLFKFILCNFLVGTLQCFRKKFNFFCPQKVEKTTLKSCSEKLKSTFFLTASSAQTAQTENFMFQNVAYRPTVYRTGSKLILRFRLILHPYAVNSFCSFFSFIKQKIADSLDLNHYFSSYL